MTHFLHLDHDRQHGFPSQLVFLIVLAWNVACCVHNRSVVKETGYTTEKGFAVSAHRYLMVPGCFGIFVSSVCILHLRIRAKLGILLIRSFVFLYEAIEWLLPHYPPEFSGHASSIVGQRFSYHLEARLYIVSSRPKVSTPAQIVCQCDSGQVVTPFVCLFSLLVANHIFKHCQNCSSRLHDEFWSGPLWPPLQHCKIDTYCLCIQITAFGSCRLKPCHAVAKSNEIKPLFGTFADISGVKRANRG